MKNLLLSFVLLITSATVFAQLYVAPVPTGRPAPQDFKEGYIFVKGEILYVEGEINLQKNPTLLSYNSEASIYLREGGQLIQGGDESTNTGTGYLSVWQHTNPTNAYAYYYWCSPVGNPLAGLGPSEIGNKNFGLASMYEIYGPSAPISARQVETIGSKEGFTDPKLTISRRWMYIHPTPNTEAEDTYIRINATDGVPAGFGFTMKGVNDGPLGAPNPPGPNYGHDQIYEFRGRPNNGDFEIPVLGPAVVDPNTPGPAIESAKMTLTGNPYPSALDLNKLFYDSDNTALNCIYYYDEDRSILSHFYNLKPFGYGVWVPGGIDTGDNPGSFPGLYVGASFSIWNAAGTQTETGVGNGAANIHQRYAPIGQGFMFVGNGDPVNQAFVKIKNSHRVFKKEGPYSKFFRPEGESNENGLSTENGDGYRSDTNISVEPAEDNRIPQLRISVVFDDKLHREMLLAFSPQASDGYDRGFDALSPMGMKSEAYFPIGPDSNRLPYVIQGTNYEPRKMVPITFKLHKTSQIEVRAVEEIRKPYQKVYLFDRQENIYRELIKPHSAASTFSLPAGTYDDRFFLVFRDGPRLANQEDLADAQDRAAGAVNMFQNNPARQLEISNPDGYTLKAAYVYDMNGKLVITENKLGDSSSYSFYTGNLSDGMYIVRLITSDDITINYKAMVVNK